MKKTSLKTPVLQEFGHIARGGPLIIQEGGGPWSHGPIFFSPRFFLGTKNFGPKLGPIFFSLLPSCPMGKNQWLDFLFFFKNFGPIFFSEPMSGPIFFSFSDHPPGWLMVRPLYSLVLKHVCIHIHMTLQHSPFISRSCSVPPTLVYFPRASIDCA